jgi:UDP-3-O-[3-hydroxymyristoyl] N-acetylglucosamine deacetylase
MALQQTLKDKLEFSGVGLHSGKTITMTIRPAEAETGIVFHRVDLSPPVSIEAIAANVVNTRLSTTIGKEGAAVSTIEHLMAALYGCGIDNAHIDIDGQEVPIMDGSAAPFVTALQDAGTKILSRPRKYLVVKKAVTIVDGDKKITISPSSYFRISFDMRFNHPVVSNQFKSMKFEEDTFGTEYASARTFGFLAEVETLKANGLARGGSLENAVVIGDEGILNEEGLRFEDEFVRHKILDSTGDFYLAGYRILGHVKAFKSGHDLNHKAVTELLAKKECWNLVAHTEADDTSAVHLPLSGLACSEA